MFNLLYKTRYGEGPTGKQAVFFACHPDDFDKCFDEIKKDILASQNCAIYYIDRRDAEEYAGYDDVQKAQYTEELSDRLSEMRLFVIPVTARLLTRPSLALDLYDLMKEKKIRIPVLALMQDGIMSDRELAGLYALKFGDLQFLDKYGVDGTMIPFAKKLENYLSSVLIGDELAERVRAAFDAYIFLSYRKKDRAYAKELMRLIHKNKFCRDIAIWYDEFLTPGEGFNGAIEAAIEKSSLFALAVTPSLLEDGNYVMTKEYPMAREIGKTVLPTQMVPTDREELEKKYHGIPACTDANDTPKLTEALMSALENVAIGENDKDPEHNFMIGLAYLAGIDVEVDVDRALELITGAAEAGVDEAVGKLVDMYMRGDGVGRDLSRAAEWQEKLAELCEQRYRESGSEDDRLRFADGLMKSGDIRSERGDLRKADKWYMQAAEIYEDIVGMTDDLHARWNLASVYCGIGQIRISAWKGLGGGNASIEEASEYYERALKIAKELADEANAPETRRNISVINGMLSELFDTYGEFDKALGYGIESLNIAAALAKKTKTPESLHDLYTSYENLGNICTHCERFTEAREYYNEATNIGELLAEKTEGALGKRELSATYGRLGVTSKEEGRLAEARGHFERALKIAAALAKEANTSDARDNLFFCCGMLGDICKAEGRLTDALRYYGQAQKTAASSAEDAEDGNSHDLAVSYEMLGDTAFDEGLLGKAEKCYRQWLDILFPAAYEHEVIYVSNYQMDQVKAFEKLGNTAREAGRLSDALKHYMNAQKFAVELFEEKRGNDEEICEGFGDIAYAEGMSSRAAEYYKRSFAIISAPEYTTYTTENDAEGARARIFDKLGDICRAERQGDRARKYYKDALEIRKKLAEKTEAVAAHRDYAMSYEKFVDTAVECGLLTGVLKHYNNILELRLKLAEKTETSGPRIDLARSYDRLGDFYRSNGQPDRAREYYKKALAIREKISKRSETVAAQLDPALSYDKLGDTAMDAGNAEEAGEYYKKALGVRLRLAKETKTAAVSRAVAQSYEKLGDAVKNEGPSDEARNLYVKSVKISEKLAEKTKTVEARRELARIYEKLGALNEEEWWYDEALESYESALSVRKELGEQTGTVEARRELAGTYDMIAGIFASQGPLETACEYYGEALEIKIKLEAETGTREARLDLVRSCDMLGDIAFGNLLFDDARRYYELGHDAVLRLTASERDPEALEELSKSYSKLADIAAKEGRHGDELSFCKKSNELSITLIGESETADDDDRLKLAFSYNKLGDIAKEEGRFVDARKYYEKLLALRQMLEKKTKRTKGRLDVIKCFGCLGETAKMQGCLDDARKYFRMASELASALFEETNDQDARREVLVSCINLGDIAKEERNKRGEARKYFERALIIGRKLERETEEAGKTEARRYIFVTCMRLGEMAKEDGQTDEARRYYSEACALAAAAAEDLKTDQSYHELALSHYTLGTFEDHRIDRDHVLTALEIWESLARSHPDNDEYMMMRDKCRDLTQPAT